MYPLYPPQTPQGSSTGHITQVWQNGAVCLSPYPSQSTTPFNPLATPSLNPVHSNFAPNYTSFSPEYHPSETPMPARQTNTSMTIFYLHSRAQHLEQNIAARFTRSSRCCSKKVIAIHYRADTIKNIVVRFVQQVLFEDSLAECTTCHRIVFLFVR
jgi:hypothetical protein